MNPTPLVFPPNKPVLLTLRGEDVLDALRGGSGRRSGSGRRPRAPKTCHHTETLLRIASRWLEKMLMTAASTRMMMNSMNTRFSE